MQRRPLQAKLTEEAAAGWDRFLTQHRVTFTAVIEAIGLLLARRRRIIPDETINMAADIDVARKSRRR